MEFSRKILYQGFQRPFLMRKLPSPPEIKKCKVVIVVKNAMPCLIGSAKNVKIRRFLEISSVHTERCMVGFFHLRDKHCINLITESNARSIYPKASIVFFETYTCCIVFEIKTQNCAHPSAIAFMHNPLLWLAA